MSSNVPMIPRPGDTRIQIPVTFDYTGGRRQKLKSRGLISLGVALLFLVIAVITLFSGASLLAKPFIIIFELYIGLWIIRFPLMGERQYRKEMQKRLSRDYVVPMSDIWSIYSITGNLVHYRNGYKGVFAMFEKKAIVGQNEQDLYDHYEAISAAYNVAGSKNITISHVDYMAGIGEDNRLRRAMVTLNSYKNGKVKTILNSIFKKVQKDSERTYTDYDIYVFLSRGNVDEFQKNIQSIVGCISRGNYSQYSYLNKKGIQIFAKTLFNLHDFSVNEATRRAFPQKDIYKVTTIKEVYLDGTEKKVGKTKDELLEEKSIKSEQTKADKRESSRLAQEREKVERKRKAEQKKKKSQKGIDLSMGIPEHTEEEIEEEFNLSEGIPEIKKKKTNDSDLIIELD